MSLVDRLVKASSLKNVTVVAKSKFLENESEMIPTRVPVINLAFSGSLHGGVTPGLHILAGASKSFKSMLGLVIAKAFQDKYEDGVVLFYDCEFGITEAYLKSNGIDTSRMIHLPVMNIEELKFDLSKKLNEELQPNDHVMILVDSLGNLASVKEVEDAKEEKSVADMSRAKSLKSLFRIVTPHLTTKKIPMIAINHTYASMDKYSGPTVSGGSGITYSSNSIFIIGKRKIREGTDLVGHTFILNAEKSRYIKEKSAIPFDVTYDGGIDTYSGLLDIAIATKHVLSPKMGWYTRVGVEGDKNWRRKESNTPEFWDPLLNDPEFDRVVHDTYSTDTGDIFRADVAKQLNSDIEIIDEETGEIVTAE